MFNTVNINLLKVKINVLRNPDFVNSYRCLFICLQWTFNRTYTVRCNAIQYTCINACLRFHPEAYFYQNARTILLHTFDYLWIENLSSYTTPCIAIQRHLLEHHGGLNVYKKKPVCRKKKHLLNLQMWVLFLFTFSYPNPTKKNDENL